MLPAAYNNQAKEYRKQQIQTASREQLLLMLYDGAIRFLVTGKKAMAENDLAQSHNNLIKTQKIITELMVTLDFEVGGDIAKNLYALYEYFNYRLVQANIHKDPDMIDEVLEHLRQLRATWDEAIKVAAKEGVFTTGENPTEEPTSPPSMDTTKTDLIPSSLGAETPTDHQSRSYSV